MVFEMRDFRAFQTGVGRPKVVDQPVPNCHLDRKLSKVITLIGDQPYVPGVRKRQLPAIAPQKLKGTRLERGRYSAVSVPGVQVPLLENSQSCLGRFPSISAVDLAPILKILR